MQLTPLQLQIQERADNTLSFGCMISTGDFVYFLQDKKSSVFPDDGYVEEIDDMGTVYNTRGCGCCCKKVNINKVIGQPISRGRLCFLRAAKSNKHFLMTNAWNEMDEGFDKKKSMYQQTLLERPVELQELVLAFLNTLGPL